MNQATVKEMRDEALLRLKLLRSPENLLQEIRNPFYITESWHCMDVISILSVRNRKNGWEQEREMAETGYYAVFWIQS